MLEARGFRSHNFAAAICMCAIWKSCGVNTYEKRLCADMRGTECAGADSVWQFSELRLASQLLSFEGSPLADAAMGALVFDGIHDTLYAPNSPLCGMTEFRIEVSFQPRAFFAGEDKLNSLKSAQQRATGPRIDYPIEMQLDSDTFLERLQEAFGAGTAIFPQKVFDVQDGMDGQWFHKGHVVLEVAHLNTSQWFAWVWIAYPATGQFVHFLGKLHAIGPYYDIALELRDGAFKLHVNDAVDAAGPVDYPIEPRGPGLFSVGGEHMGLRCMGDGPIRGGNPSRFRGAIRTMRFSQITASTKS